MEKNNLTIGKKEEKKKDSLKELIKEELASIAQAHMQKQEEEERADCDNTD